MIPMACKTRWRTWVVTRAWTEGRILSHPPAAAFWGQTPILSESRGFRVKLLCDCMAILASIFLGIAIIETFGKLLFDFPQVPYLTANIAGPFDYAWAYAIALYGVRWGLQKMVGIEDDEQTEPVGGIVEVEAAPPAWTWACQCGRTNPADNFNCAACSAEQPPLSSSRWT